MAFTTGILFALFFNFFFLLFAFVLKKAYIKVALEHYKHQKCRRKKKQPAETGNSGIKIGEIVKEFKEPDNIANNSGNNSGNSGVFVLPFASVWANDGEKYKVKHPANSHKSPHIRSGRYFLSKHNDKCKQKITSRKYLY